MDPFMPLMIVTTVLLLSLLMTEVFSALKTSVFIGLILAGAFLGLPIFDDFISQGIPIIESLSTFGIILLLFISGLQADYRKLAESRKEESFIALLGALIPFTLGFVIGQLMGYDALVSFVIGAGLSITSAGTTVSVLLETKTLNTRVGSIILGAGIIDDVFEVLFLSILIVLVQHGSSTNLLALPFKILVFTMLVLAFFKLALPRLIRHAVRQENRSEFIGLLIALCFVTALISHFLGLGPVVGAFLAGIFIQLLIKNRLVRKQIVSQIRNFSFALIIPFFFIHMGLRLDLAVVEQHIVLFLIVLVIAIVGKVGGALLTKPFVRLTPRQLHLIGWGMNSRGAVELVIAQIALVELGLPLEVYSVLVMTAIATTFIFPFVLRYFVRRYPQIME